MSQDSDPLAAFRSLIHGELAPVEDVNELAVEAAEKVAAILLEASDRFTDNHEGDHREIWREPVQDLRAWVQIAWHNCVTGNTVVKHRHSDVGCGNDDGAVKWADALRIADAFIAQHPTISPDGLSQSSSQLINMAERHKETARPHQHSAWWASWQCTDGAAP